MKRLFAMLLALALLAPTACAVTREDVLEELGVFDIGELSCVEKAEIIHQKDFIEFVLQLQDGIIVYGTDNSSTEWFTSSGVVCEADVDLDGDGAKEYIVIDAERVDEYDLSQSMRIYAREGGELSLKGEFPLRWAYDNQGSKSWVRIVKHGGDAAIFNGCMSEGDGASNFMSVVVYDYDGAGCSVELYGITSNYGEFRMLKDADLAGLEQPLTFDIIYEMAEAAQSEDSAEQGERVNGPMFDAGVQTLNTELDAYGIKALTTEHLFDDWGYISFDSFSGGTDIMTTSSNDRYAVLKLGMVGPIAEEQAEGLETWAPRLSDELWWEILPESDERKLTRVELSGCDSELLGYIRNEILARHGYVFTKEKYQEYFGGKSWYEPNENFSFGDLSEIENSNIELIQSLE